MITQSHTRRGILGGAVAMPVVMISGTSDASLLSPVPAPALAALMAAACDCLAASTAYHRDVYTPARDQLDAALGAVPHFEIRGGTNVLGGQIVQTTASSSSVAVTRTVVRMAREGKSLDAETVAQARKFQAGHLRRERTKDAIRREAGIWDRFKQANALADAASAALDAVATYPVQSAADLAQKLAFMIEHDLGDGVDWLPQMLADVRALEGGR